MKYNERGEELPDDTPVEVPLHWKRPPTLRETIASMIRAEDFRKAADAAGVESFEEANDFGEEDDELPQTPYEVVEMQEESYDSDRAALAREKEVSRGRSQDEARVGRAGADGKADSSDGESVDGVAGAGEKTSGRDSASGGAAVSGKA